MRSTVQQTTTPMVYVTVERYPRGGYGPEGSVALIYDDTGKFVTQYDQSKHIYEHFPCSIGAVFTVRVLYHDGADRYEQTFVFTATGNPDDQDRYVVGPGLNERKAKRGGGIVPDGFLYGVDVTGAVPADTATAQAVFPYMPSPWADEDD